MTQLKVSVPRKKFVWQDFVKLCDLFTKTSKKHEKNEVQRTFEQVDFKS